jgi:hypothetical protein
MMGAIILQGMHFLAPKSIMVTMPDTGNLDGGADVESDAPTGPAPRQNNNNPSNNRKFNLVINLPLSIIYLFDGIKCR